MNKQNSRIINLNISIEDLNFIIDNLKANPETKQHVQIARILESKMIDILNQKEN